MLLTHPQPQKFYDILSSGRGLSPTQIHHTKAPAMKCTAVIENTSAHDDVDSRMSPVRRVANSPANVEKVLPSPKMAPACRGAMSSWLTLTAPSVSAISPDATAISTDADAGEFPTLGEDTASRHSAGPSMPITYMQRTMPFTVAL